MHPHQQTRNPKSTICNHRLVRAARGEPGERPPVWAMRQAGRWDPEFNRLRSGLSFYEFSENVELAAKASLLRQSGCAMMPTRNPCASSRRPTSAMPKLG